MRIRELILRGELVPGERLAEVALAARLGVSRTPIRQALPALAREGLLSPAGRRGYRVRSFSPQEVSDAIELRGVLEGLAARRLAERGASRETLERLKGCLEEGDALLAKPRFDAQGESAYGEMNERFHKLLMSAAESRVIRHALEQNDHVPFASAKALAFERDDMRKVAEVLRYAHRQHHAIVQAIENREGARVEALFREHASLVKENLNLEGSAAASPQRLAMRLV